MVIRTEHWRGSSPRPGRRKKNGVGHQGWEGGNTPLSGKNRSQGALREAWPALTGFSAGQGPPMGLKGGGGGTYKMVHIWPDGAAFPRRTWLRSPGLQPPFQDRRKRSRSRADIREGPPWGHGPSCP